MRILLLVIAVLFLVTACGQDETQKAKGDHVWQEQERALNKAKQVEQLIIDTDQQRRQQMDQ